MDGHVISILISAREDNLASDRKGTEVLMLGQCGNEENILVLEWHISHSAIEYALNIKREYLLGAVGLHTAQNSLADKSLFFKACRTLNQATNRSNLIAQLVHARAEHGALDLYHILITIED